MSELSVEQLRKQAKELARFRRAATPDYKLADAQREIARDAGFSSWAAFVRALPLESLARRVADAYARADFTAIREVNWEWGTGLAWHREPEKMHARLPTWSAAEVPTDALALADARLLVARQSGYESWTALVQSLAPQARPETPFCRLEPDGRTLEVRGFLTESHWDAALALAREQVVTGIVAGGVTDVALDKIARLGAVTRLNLDNSGALTDDGLRRLAELPALEELDLSSPRSRVTDAGLEVLRHLPRLRRFKMCWAPKVTDAGLAHLSACDALESVDLMGVHAGDGTLAALAGKAALRNLTTGRAVTDAGLPLLHEIPNFRGGDGARLLLDGPFTDAGLARLAGLAGLEELGFFWHATAMTSAGLAVLAELPRLTVMACEGSLCDDVAMAHLGRAPALRRLNAQGTVATDDGFVALSRSRTLEDLWGRECPNLTGRGFTALAELPRLQSLAVSCARVEDASLAALPSFPALTKLVTIDVRDDGFRYVGKCAGLETLQAMYCRDTGDAATSHLSGLTRLTSYYAGMTRITDASLAVLARLSSLESLEFWQVAGITDAGVRALAGLPKLRALSVDGSPKVSRAVASGFREGVRVTITG